MKKILYTTLALSLLVSCGGDKATTTTTKISGEVAINKEVLKDKIKGGWAGQTIGCTYGGPTEFKYRGALIHDYENLLWYDDYAYDTFIEDPGLYDDVYMDLTFVEILERVGLDAPADSFAVAFANDDYKLWHANQAARYNILSGIMPPESGHWKNNPHADDIDFQIEADFIGLMTPGMINTGSAYADKIGHIMNYGDGWYGGVYMSAMYSLAFVSDDMQYVVEEGLKTIPQQSKFYKCIKDVIDLHKQYPNDWKACWFEIEKRHASEIGCPEGVFNAFNIDATLNSAYVVIGLLYGEKDFFKTMDISTRCGQDSDCNPATAAGILGVMIGYENIPNYWKPAMERVENLDFPYTTISLTRIYDLSYKHGLELIKKNGGREDDQNVYVQFQQPETVRFEQSFEGLYPSLRKVINKEVYKENFDFQFKGSAVIVMGFVKRIQGTNEDYVLYGDVYIDDKKVEEIRMPYDYIKRKYDVFYTYDLPEGDHKLRIEWKNPHPDFRVQLKDVVTYSTQPLKKFTPPAN